ncbi:5-formyltetrahydrofolate cyclo-ligase [Bdellovibrio sp. HCB288]|uniref:5-formyltetrahydrofolate cyclo-ligase n=1 Tax=Bdellovibrio sp. HCB288 TaxID=3394355 RepID=UPI0039B3A4B1
MPSWSSKQECRSFYKSLCAQEFAQGLVQNQQQLNVFLQDFMSRQNGCWGAYRSLSQEVSVDQVFKIEHIDWVFPRIKGTELEFCFASGFSQGAFGVLEPDPNSAIIDLKGIHGLLIPGLVFNKNGNRLGKGKGFYDKTLAHFKGVKVGVCFDFQISEQTLPMEAHDEKMDYILTESGLIVCQQFEVH